MDLNHVTLTGILERDPITRFADHGTQQVHFTLKLIEPGPAGQAFKLFVPVEAYSQVAELAEKVQSLESHPLVRETRTIGLTAAVELEADALERETGLPDRVVLLAREQGVLTRSLRGCALHISPPFVIEPRQIAVLVEALGHALDGAQ